MNKNGYKVRCMDVHTKDAVNEQILREPARPCDDLAPLRHMMEERKREKLRQHLTNAIVEP